ncbi:MAG TPA: PAS domain-containing protein, partial [Thermomonas sp.]|nr:PAS domain-containing protein [Thermomonas sp.]
DDRMTDTGLRFLDGGGELGARMRDMAWEETALGAPASWPEALRTLVALMLASNQPMYVVWGPSRAFLYNAHYAPFLGAKHPWALGRDLLDEVWPEIRDELAPLVASAQAGEPVHVPRMQLTLQRHGYPEDTWFSFFFAPVRDAGGAVAGMFGACNEITAQVRLEQGMSARDARHRQVLANMEEAFVLFDREFRVLEVNAETERLVRMDRGQMVGRSHWDLFPGTHDASVGHLYRRVMAERRPESIEYFHTFEDGRQAWFEVRAFPVDEGLAAFFHDITRRREERQAAALAAERVQLALDAGAIVGTWVWQIPEDRISGDGRFAHLFGLDEEACRTGLPLGTAFDAIHPEDRARVAAAIDAALAHGGPYRCEYRVLTRDGSWAWVEANGRVEMDAAGKPVRFPGVLLRHDERHQVEAERDQALALLRTFIEAVPGVVYAKDREGRLLVGNRGVAELLGVPPEAYVGRTDRELLSDPVQAEALMANDRRIMETGVGEQLEEEIVGADGALAVWLSTKAPWRNEAGEVVGLIGASLDITDRKRIEQALRVSEQRSALALDVAQLGTWSWDLVADVIRLDARTAEIGNTAPGRREYGREDLARRIHPDDWNTVQSALAAALDPAGDGRVAAEFRVLRPDGRVVWAMTRGQASFEGEGAARRAVSMVGTVLDVTERRVMIELLEQSDRRKDEFLAMLAHELRNPLAPIGTAAELLRLAPGDATRVADAARIISRQVAHMTDMVDDLLDVSRVTRGLVEFEQVPVDVRAVVTAAVEQAQPALAARRHTLAVDTSGGPAIVKGDRHRLVQVVSNLLHNAAKYTPPQGLVRLSVAVSADTVAVRVSDNGIGMEASLVPRVFDLFTQAERTPDRSQGGLGIGLALVRSIVRGHGGSVSAASPGVGGGSTFEVVLPRVAMEASDAVGPVSPGPVPARRHTVMVVDDNRDAAMTLATVLELFGHDVSVAADGREALALAAARADWDAFILDIGMPDMTGHELVGHLRSRLGDRPARFIALTGYGQAQDLEASRKAGFDHHLVKPADIDRIVALLEP